MKINREIIEKLVDGYWYIQPHSDWYIDHIAETKFNCTTSHTLFVAMDKDTWLRGTGNTGLYANWNDTHELVLKFPKLINGIVAQKPIEALPKNIPQYIVKNPYEFIIKCSEFVRENLLSKVIAITGVVGKSTTTEYTRLLLSNFGNVYSTNGNHNSRTGVRLTITNAMHQPDFAVVETAIAALWTKNGGISKFTQPDIAVITEIGVGQRGYDEDKTAFFKCRIANGIKKDGIIIINRDIQNFDVVLKYCSVFSHNIMTYGRHLESDIKIISSDQKLVLKIKNEIIEFDVAYDDDGSISNATAAISIIYALGLDYKKALNVLGSVKKKDSVLQKLYNKDKKICIIDDTYNAQISSMLNAFKYCKSKFQGNRKILVVGDIVNLDGEAKEIHKSLKQPILNSGFDLIITYGKYTKYLNDILPREKVLGHFTDNKLCAEEVAKILKDGDVVLVKGSRRNSIFYQIPYLILENLDGSNSTLPISMNKNKIIDKFSVIYNPNVTLEKTTLNKEIDYGLGGLILLYLVLKKVVKQELKLDLIYTVSDKVHNEGKNRNALGLKKGEQYTLFDLLQMVVITQKADTILALAELSFKTTSQALLEIKEEASSLGINNENIRNITGRNIKGEIQYSSVNDILLIAKLLINLPLRVKKILDTKYITFKNQVIKSISNIDAHTIIANVLFFGDRLRRTYIVFGNDNKSVGIFYKSDIEDNNAIDYLAPYYHHFGEPKLESKQVFAKTANINIMGDTYFGEFYTRNRSKRKVEDALSQYGYSYSFEKIKNIFNKDDLNIANFEAVFNCKKISPLAGIKPYILDADKENTLKELKSRNINYLVCANNHAKDYGDESLAYTLNAFEQENIGYIGVGRDQQQANKFIEVKYKEKVYAIFNGYWHRDSAYLDFDFYALGQKSGVSSINAVMFELIKRYKNLYPERKIIVVCHWGVDFKPIQKYQRKLANILTSIGVDLIIGHGPHTIQPIEIVNGKPVIFSIGNGVFNSNGEYEKHNALPYGLIARINMETDSICLYPIYTHNIHTFWQPYFVEENQFKIVEESLLEFFDTDFNIGKDDLGRFIDLGI